MKMEYYKISKVLNNSTVSKHLAKMDWNNDLSSRQCSVDENVRFKTSILGSDLCEYSDSYIAV